jgi:hypothetical protein
MYPHRVDATSIDSLRSPKTVRHTLCFLSFLPLSNQPSDSFPPARQTYQDGNADLTVSIDCFIGQVVTFKIK